MSVDIKTQVVVIGSGPGGYSAAFRSADLGMKTILIDDNETLGGVCLNAGCIPSKGFLHISKIINELKLLKKNNIIYDIPNINIDNLKKWNKKIVKKLTNSLFSMSKLRNINFINGYGKFINQNNIVVEQKNKELLKINFEKIIIATGSQNKKISFINKQNDYRIWDSTDALKLNFIPKNFLIIGGGVIGLEIATIYHTLGSKIDIVEFSNQIISLADEDIIKCYVDHIKNDFNIMLNTKIINIDIKNEGLYVSMEHEKSSKTICYDAILIAIGRVPNSMKIDIEKSGVQLDYNKFISVDKQMRTNIPNIYAIGDVVGQPMLAHKAVHEGHIAAEVIYGKKHFFEPKVIPYIAYTDPEIGWVGITEKIAKNLNINYDSVIFPWSASGRAIASNCDFGMTKLIFEKKSKRIIGGAVVGVNGGEILGEISLAIEMGCDVEDISLTIHAHPTLYESIYLASSIYNGTITDLPNIKYKNNNFF